MLSYNLDFNSCAIRDGFRKSSHKYYHHVIVFTYTYVREAMHSEVRSNLNNGYMYTVG